LFISGFWKKLESKKKSLFQKTSALLLAKDTISATPSEPDQLILREAYLVPWLCHPQRGFTKGT